MAFDDSITLKTLTLDATREYVNEKVNVSGVRVIKLGYRPAGVEIWISTENTGDNLYKLENKGDGWINIPEPLYNCYITTRGVNYDEKISLYYSGELSDNFAVGNAVAERVGAVEKIDTFSNTLLRALYDTFNNSFNYLPIKDNTYYTKNFVGFFRRDYATTVAQGFNYALLMSKIADLKSLQLDNDTYYKIHILGHIDIGANDDTIYSSGASHTARSIHLNLFNLADIPTNKIVDISSSYPNIENLYEIQEPTKEYTTLNNHFTIFGARETTSGAKDGYLEYGTGKGQINETYTFKGEYLNRFTDFILWYKSSIWIGVDNRPLITALHFSLQLTISRVVDLSNISDITNKPSIPDDNTGNTQETEEQRLLKEFNVNLNDFYTNLNNFRETILKAEHDLYAYNIGLVSDNNFKPDLENIEINKENLQSIIDKIKEINSTLEYTPAISPKVNTTTKQSANLSGWDTYKKFYKYRKLVLNGTTLVSSTMISADEYYNAIPNTPSDLMNQNKNIQYNILLGDDADTKETELRAELQKIVTETLNKLEAINEKFK